MAFNQTLPHVCEPDSKKDIQHLGSLPLNVGLKSAYLQVVLR